MSAKTAALTVVIMALAWSLVGCNYVAESRKSEEKIVIPPHVEGTVSQYATLVGGGDIAVQGYGIVFGLGRNGCSQVPPHLRKYFIKYLTHMDFGLWTKGTQMLTPGRFLRDPDTAIVLVAGSIPPGAPKGSRFDVYVSALPQTQTQSLEGGMLMPIELRLAWQGLAVPGGPSFPWADCAGDVFVNPFLDVSKPADLAKSRTGKIIGGGKAVKSRPIILQLRQADYAMAKLIERRVNERFPGLDKWDKTANAKGAAEIELTIPPNYRWDYEHFFEVVMHIPIRTAGAVWENHARRITAAMELPDANHHELALVWEAMGRQVLPVVKLLYTSRNDSARYYAARAGLRLGDTGAADIVLQFTRLANTDLQMEAIRELGRHRGLLRAVPILCELLDDENELVRVAAYEALRARGNRSRIRRLDIGGQFQLDLVDSRREYVIYATQTKQPRIVLFGRDMTIAHPVFFTAPDDMVTIASTRKYHTVAGKDAGNSNLAQEIAFEECGIREVEIRGRYVDESGTSVRKKKERIRTYVADLMKANPNVNWAALKPGQKLLLPPADRLLVYRKIPRTGRMSGMFYLDFRVRTLIETLGLPVNRGRDNKIRGLSLTYSQVLGVLYRMCKEGNISAKFVLQQPAELRRMYRGAVTAGRPNMPGE